MKYNFLKFTYLAFFLSLVIINNSCDNTLDLVEDRVETPVVYAMLNYQDEYQYVRLERAFASETISAITLAQNPDSLYYKNAEVKLTRIRNGVSIEKTLEKVNGNDIGYVREDGIFAKDPNTIYRIKTSELNLAPLDIVKLSINIGDDQLVTSETMIIEEAVPSKPRVGTAISFSEDQSETYTWNAFDDRGGKIHSVKFIIKFTEEINGVETPKQLEWKLINNTDAESVRIAPGEFYTFMSNNLTKDPSIKRFFDSVDFILTSGDENYQKFVIVNQANSGITSSGEIPIFTNLSRGYGLFGSKANAQLIGLGINVTTLDNLRKNPMTKDLNFQ